MVASFMAAGFFVFLMAVPARGNTIDWGLLHLNLGVEAGFEYTDNLNNTEKDRKENLYLDVGPLLQGGITLPLHVAGQEGESLEITTGFTYTEKYSLSGNENQQTFSSPIVANFRLPARVFDWRLNLDDTFTFRDEPLETTVAVGASSFNQYNNNLTLNATRSFGRGQLSLTAGRLDQFSPDVPETDETIYQFTVTPGFQVRQNYYVYWRNSYGVVELADQRLQDSEGYSTEVGVSGQITKYLNGNISIGYAHSYLKGSEIGPGSGIFGGIFDPIKLKADNVDGISSSLAASYAHPLRPNTSYSVVFFHSPGVTAVLKQSSVTEISGAQLVISHLLARGLTINPVLSWTHAANTGRVAPGAPSEVTDLMGLDLRLVKSLTPNTSASFEYRFQMRTSNVEGSDYHTTLIMVKGRYNF